MPGFQTLDVVLKLRRVAQREEMKGRRGLDNEFEHRGITTANLQENIVEKATGIFKKGFMKSQQSGRTSRRRYVVGN